MNESTSRTLLILAVIAFILLIAWPVKLLLFAPVGAINAIFHGRTFDHMPDWAWPWVGFAGFFALAALAVWIAIIVWVYKDAEKRRMSGALWAIVVFFAHLIGLLIYFIVRADHPIAAAESASQAQAQTCPKCGKSVEAGHTYCPSCGERLQPVCPKCKEPVKPEWKVCPHCGQKL